ncbi:5'-nucleotidase C-terminal domain-containing protein [Virgibacillus oceani]
MQSRSRRKYLSIMMIFVLMTSILTPAAGPVSIQAAEVDESITVEDAIGLNNDGSEQTVEGYIVGYVISPDNVSDNDFREDHNLALADEAGESDPDNMLFIQLSSEYRSEFGLASNPDNLGEEIVVTGDMEEYHTHYGLKNPSDMKFASENEDPSEPEPLELQSIAEVREQDTGEVKTKGVVTAKLKNTIQIQDETAAIAVRPTSLDVQVGDEITVIGTLNNYRGLLQLDGASVEDKTSDVVPEPVTLQGNELENHQSQLAVVHNVTLTDVEDGGDWANYTAEDEAGNVFVVRDETGELSLETDVNYESITGMVIQFDDDQQIIPRSQSDIIGDASAVQPVTASPAPGMIPAGAEVTLETATENAEIFYTTDGSDPSSENGELYSGTITVDEDVTINAIAEKDGLTASNIAAFSYTVYDAEDGFMIHDIQGEGHESPLVGVTVEDVEGIVTYKYELRGANYFHMQTPEADYDGNEATSEGIVVYTGNQDLVEVGNLVQVTGEVDEYHIDGYDNRAEEDLSVTQIAARDDWGGHVEVIENDVELPAAIELTSSDIPEDIIGDDGFDSFDPENYAIDFWESIEGMRVEIAPSRAVAPQEHGDLVVATNEFSPANTTANGGIRLTEEGPNAQTIQYKLQPNDDARDFAVKTGDQFTEPIEGVVNYGYGNYKVYADLDEVEAVFEEGDTQPDPTTTINKDDDKLTVANYNVENFSANTSETSAQKAGDIARAFVNDMENPDIVGIVEVMDNNGQTQGPDDADASESYERLIDEIRNQGGVDYDYVNIDPEYNQDGGAPHGNIRVGFLYNPDRVSLVDGEHGTATEATNYDDGRLTLNPGRIAPTEDAFKNTRKPLAAQFEFNGESVVVVNNHFNSKSGDDGEFGQNQPPVKGSELQRHEMAAIVNDFVADIKAENPNENVVVLGDMNDFEFTETMNILEGDELTNVIMNVPEEERYTYLYQGNSQVLDHVLVSNHLADVTEVDVLHVNADFTDMHGRASDHDPILTQIDLAAEEAAGDFELSIMHMNDTHARVEPMPKMITAINEYREENPEALLLNAGDVFSGTLYFNEFNGLADLAMLNLMDMDAMVFGNHEFDLGAVEDGHESLAAFVENANFPFLGTNIDFSGDPFMRDLETNESLANDPEDGKIYDSFIMDVEGEQVGIFGLDTEDTANVANPEEVTFADFAETAEQAVADFEDAGIDKIIALTHIGYDSAPEMGNDLRLAEEVDGIDIIIGGHSHTALEDPVLIDRDGTEPTVIAQAGDYAEFLGTLSVTFDENGVVSGYEGELLEVADYAEDPDAVEVLQPYKTQVDEVMNEETGAEAMKELTNPRQSEPGDDSVRANETELGNLVTDAMLAKAQEKFPETVISFQNGGGIRAPIDEGPITTGEVIEVLPFGNDPVIVTLTGQEIKDILEHSVRQAPAENGGFLHVSGMKFFYDSEMETGNRVVQMYVEVDGELEEIQLDGAYQVTTNGFTGQGGDGFETFAQAYDDGRVRDIGEIDWQQLRDYMVEDAYLGGIVDPEREGRIVDLLGEELPEDPGNGDGDFELSLMHMNDTHARADELPKMVTAVNEFRSDNPESLLLHAGDVFSGTLYFNEFNGQADLELLNLMDFDAMVFGNHEFDLGGEEGGHASLAAFVENANFPFLGTNVDFSQDPFMSELETNQSLVSDPENGEIYDSIIMEVDGEEIGVFGLTTEDTANIANPADVTFADFAETAERTVEAFEEAGIDKIIALTHIGYDSAPEVGNDLRLAEEVDGIDVIVGGHSHTALEEPVSVPEVVLMNTGGEAAEPTVIVQAGQYAENLGTLDVTFDENGVITGYEGELVDTADYAEDPEALEVLAPYKEQVDEVMNEEIGAEAMKDLINPRQDEPGDDSVRANETELGNLITDAMLAGAQEDYPETVIAFQNGGGIRAPIDEGPITSGEVINVLPFGNNPVVFTLNGQELKDILEHSVRQAPAESGGFLHVSGMQFYYDSEKEPGNRIVQMYVEIEGELVEILPEEEYQVTTNAFTAQGGDGFETLAGVYEDGRVRDIGASDWEQLRDYMVEDLGGIVDPEREGRIVDLMGEEFPEEPGDDDNGNEDPGDNGDNGDPGDPGDNGNNGDSGQNDDDTTPGGNGEDPGPNGDGITPGGKGNGSYSGGDSTPPGGTGATLPDTATNLYMYLLIGTMLLAAGGVMLFYRRRYLQ